MWYVTFHHPEGKEEPRTFEGLKINDIFPSFEQACKDWDIKKKYDRYPSKHDFEIILSKYDTGVPEFHKGIRELTTVRKVPHRVVHGHIVLLE